MKGVLLGMVSLLSMFVARPSQAKVEFEVGARLGYAVPTGDLWERSELLTEGGSGKLSDFSSGQIPLGLELGVRLLPMLTLGGYLELAPGILGSRSSDACDAVNHDCSVLGVHLGLMAHLHFLPHQAVDPWLGAGVGFEALAGREELASDQAAVLTFGGAEFPVRVGVDFKLSEKFYLGPYVGYTFGTFSKISLSCDGTACPPDISGDITETAGHGWFGFGAKLTILAF